MSARRKVPFTIYGALIIVIIWVGVIALIIANAEGAEAHDWYPTQCCHDEDCHRLKTSEWKEVKGGYSVKGKFYPYSDVRPSEDTEAHICENANGYVPYSNTTTDEYKSCVFIPGGMS